jgi:hypothetical protein
VRRDPNTGTIPTAFSARRIASSSERIRSLRMPFSACARRKRPAQSAGTSDVRDCSDSAAHKVGASSSWFVKSTIWGQCAALECICRLRRSILGPERSLPKHDATNSSSSRSDNARAGSAANSTPPVMIPQCQTRIASLGAAQFVLEALCSTDPSPLPYGMRLPSHSRACMRQDSSSRRQSSQPNASTSSLAEPVPLARWRSASPTQVL